MRLGSKLDSSAFAWCRNTNFNRLRSVSNGHRRSWLFWWQEAVSKDRLETSLAGRYLCSFFNSFLYRGLVGGAIGVGMIAMPCAVKK